jgi:hypothetical protein
MIDDADLCLEPCNINGGITSWYNAQDACEVKIQNMKNSDFATFGPSGNFSFAETLANLVV